MLLQFKIMNYKSFKNKTSLSLVTKSKIRDFGGHEQKLGPLSVLKYASIYGANAVGKSNLIASIQSLKDLITQGSFYDIRPFKDNDNKDVVYEVVFEKDNYIFNYSITVCNASSQKKVEIDNESLTLLDLDKNIKKVVFDTNGISGEVLSNDAEKAFLEKLYYANCRSNKRNVFLKYFIQKENNIPNSDAQMLTKKAFEFFARDLVIVSNNIDGYSEINDTIVNKISEKLELLDTGIKKVKFEKCNNEEISQNIPKFILKEILDKFNSSKDDKHRNLTVSLTNGLYIYNFKEDSNGEVIAKKIVSEHKGINSPFEFDEESDGTKRMILLCALLFGNNKKDKVYIFDEFERSLHPLLANAIIEDFIKNNKDSKSQLIITSHLPLFMDTAFRKDELFVLNKDPKGYSSLCPLISFTDIRSDTKLSKNYLLGKYGGTPVVDGDYY